MKKCSRCKNHKPIEEFTAQGYCLDCTSEYNAEYYQQHADKLKARANERYANDAEFRRKRSEYMKAYRKRKANG